MRPHLKNIRPAVMTVGGWFDAENLFGALETYRTVEANSPGATNILVMGPWSHGGWGRGDGETLGHVPLRRQDGRVLPRADRVPLLRVPLEGKGNAEAPRGLGLRDRHQPVADSTTPGRRGRPWPRSLFLQARAGSPSSPRPTSDDRRASTSTRAIPPSRSSTSSRSTIGMAADYMVGDQRFAVAPARRPGLPDAAAGRRTSRSPARSRPSCTSRPRGTDSDWIVKLIDVYPDDYPGPESEFAGASSAATSSSCAATSCAASSATACRSPSRSCPDEPTAVSFALPDIDHTFRDRPPDHGAGPEQLVPAGRPQPADVRRHLQRQGVGLPQGDPARLPRPGEAVLPGGARASEVIGPEVAGFPGERTYKRRRLRCSWEFRGASIIAPEPEPTISASRPGPNP